jgi:hypothetical protein
MTRKAAEEIVAYFATRPEPSDDDSEVVVVPAQEG